MGNFHFLIEKQYLKFSSHLFPFTVFKSGSSFEKVLLIFRKKNNEGPQFLLNSPQNLIIYSEKSQTVAPSLSHAKRLNLCLSV